MKQILTIVALLFTFLVNAQDFIYTSDNISRTGTANNGIKYNYEAKVSARSYLPGMGDIRYQLSVTNYRITSIRYNGKYYNDSKYGFPIEIPKIQTDVYFTLKYSRSYLSYQTATTNESNMLAVGQGYGDYGDLSKEDVEWVKTKCDVGNRAEFLELSLILDDINLKNTYFEELAKVKREIDIEIENKKKDTKIEDLKYKINRLGNSKEDLVKKRELYRELDDIDTNKNYTDTIIAINDAIQKANQKELAKAINEDLDNKEKEKKEAEKKEDKKSEYELKFWSRQQAEKYINMANNTSDASEKTKLLKQALNHSYGLYPNEVQALEKKVKDAELRESVDDLIKIDWGYGDRHMLLQLYSGFNGLWGSYKDQFDASIPLGVSTEFTLPLSRSFAFELYADYEFNLMLNFEQSQSSSTLDNFNRPEITEEIEYGKYSFGLGFNFGKMREFSFLIVNDNTKYFYQKFTDGELTEDIGLNKFIDTYGVGLSYNSWGKSKNELFRIIGTYSINNETVQFINPKFETNDISNLKLKMDAGLGAFSFGFEYNLFNDKINDYTLNTIALRLGIKIGV